jgi:hypothetical protein
LSLSSYNSADPSSLSSDVRGPCAGRSGHCCDRRLNSSGRPGLHRSGLLDVPPQAHEGMTLRIIGPTGPSGGILSFWWTRGISVPHMVHVWRPGLGHDPFNSVRVSPTRAMCRAWAVASARSAGPTRHDYIFLFYKNRIYICITYIQY